MTYDSHHDGTVDRMVALLAHWEHGGDQRAPFLRCYLMMTRNMLEGVERGEFHDPVWVERLVHRFAEYYFYATEAFDAKQATCPTIWSGAHGAAIRGNVFIAQRLLLGINAHINYDLVLALVDVLEDEWPDLDDERKTRRYEDYVLVNVVIGRTIDDVQDLVVEKEAVWLDVFDKAMGRVDEWLVSRLITRWRRGIWDRAVQMLESGGADGRETVRMQVESEALVRADAILLKDGFRRLIDLV